MQAYNFFARELLHEDVSGLLHETLQLLAVQLLNLLFADEFQPRLVALEQFCDQLLLEFGLQLKQRGVHQGVGLLHDEKRGYVLHLNAFAAALARTGVFVYAGAVVAGALQTQIR